MKTSQNLARPAAAGLLAAGLLACSFGSSPVVSREMLAHQIESGTAPVVLDVRSESEYVSGHVPGAIHIPFHVYLKGHMASWERDGLPQESKPAQNAESEK